MKGRVYTILFSRRRTTNRGASDTCTLSDRWHRRADPLRFIWSAT
jgi:hypothetical protein